MEPRLCHFWDLFLPTPDADPFLRGWEGGVSVRGAALIGAANGAGAGRNSESDSGVGKSDLIVTVTGRVRSRPRSARLTLDLGLDVRLHLTLVNVDCNGRGRRITGRCAPRPTEPVARGE